jgi:hypothetical protein
MATVDAAKVEGDGSCSGELPRHSPNRDVQMIRSNPVSPLGSLPLRTLVYGPDGVQSTLDRSPRWQLLDLTGADSVGEDHLRRHLGHQHPDQECH